MRKQIFRSICLVAAMATMALLVLVMGVLYGYFSDVQQHQLKHQTQLAAKAVSDEGKAYFKHLDTSDGYRITWVDANGTVLYDNQESIQTMGNHSNREEIKEAIKKGVGKSDRYSDTLMHRYFYYAQKLDDGTILRMATVQSSLFTLVIQMLRPMLVILIIVVVVALGLASRLAHQIVAPLNALNLENPLSNDAYDEVSPLLNRMDEQQKQLLSQEFELQRRKEAFDAVTTNMNEGLILLNIHQEIIMMNHMAQALLGATASDVGCSIYEIRHFSYIASLLADPQPKEVIKVIDGQDYLFSASLVTRESSKQGWALFIRNVTEKKQAEKLRREFTANVSHELKTPLHTIRGCAELMLNGLVKPADEVRFEQQIYKEAQRMIDLVEDIISLSHLDEESMILEKERVDLYQIACTAMDSLQELAEQKHIRMELHGQSVWIRSVPSLLFSVIYNLCDNAVKYNKENGKVDVYVEEKEGYPIVSVIDTGIGIPKKCQPRIFERFYRVDTSHSKEVGGTGLGLSIVKHALTRLRAELRMDSQVGKGTKMEVWLPIDSTNAASQ